MVRKFLMAAGLLLAATAGACATGAKKTDDAIQIVMGPDGKATLIMPEGASAEDAAMLTLMQAALNGKLDEALAEADAEPLTEEQIWNRDADGNLAHIQSGATCPAVWAGMQRTQAQIFRDDGTDVGCNYGAPNSATVMTFYVYATEDDISPADEARAVLETMKTRQPVAKETAYLAPSRNGQYEALTLAYDNADGSKMRTSVLVARAGQWLLKIRLTCLEGDARIAEGAAGLALIGQADRLNGSPAPKMVRPDPV